MNRADVTEAIIDAKRSKGLGWADLCRTLGTSKEPDPKGDRVNIVMSGKFLPYKTY